MIKNINDYACLQVIMDRIYKGVMDKVNNGGAFGKAFFEFAYEYKKSKLLSGYDTPLLNKYVVFCVCLSISKYFFFIAINKSVAFCYY